MKVPDCPKNLFHCSSSCPLYRCWALDKHLEKQDRLLRDKDKGWD